MVDASLFAYGFTHHRKVRKLTDAAFRLWVSALDHAYEDGTGGIVVQSDIDHFPHAPKAGVTRDAVTTELVEVGLWRVRDGLSWLIHGFDEWRALQLSLVPEGELSAPSPLLVGKPSQIGGVARAAQASRTPAGHFAPSSRTPAEHQPTRQLDSSGDVQPDTSQRPADTPAGHQPTSSEDTSRTSSGGVAPSPPHPLSVQNEGSNSERASESGCLDRPVNKGSARARRTRLPEDFEPTPEHVTRAEREGVDLAPEVEKFKLHAVATGRLMANWNAAFTTWLINAKKYAPKQNRNLTAFDAQERARNLAAQERRKLAGGTS